LVIRLGCDVERGDDSPSITAGGDDRAPTMSVASSAADAAPRGMLFNTSAGREVVALNGRLAGPGGVGYPVQRFARD
jgi:hypothetical protein